MVQGGVEKHCEELCPRLAKLGCEVAVATRSPYIPKERRLKEWRGTKFIHLWAPRQRNFEAIIHSVLATIIARLKSPDILHIHAVGPSLVTPLAKILGLKVVMTHHGPDYERKKWGKVAKMALRAGEFFGVNFAEKTIAISHTIKSEVEKKYSRKYPVCIPNGVNLPKILPPGETLRKYGLKKKRYIFTACRFVPEKGLHDLISAYQKINNPEYSLVIAGDADHETDYSRGIKTKAKENKMIVLTGFLFGSSLQELYSNAGLFVLPSYFEGLPITLLEAMSFGLPVLVSDIPQLREVKLPEYRYFPVGNSDKLAEKIEELMRRQISEEEKETQFRILKENYDWDNIASKTLAVYKSCLKKSA